MGMPVTTDDDDDSWICSEGEVWTRVLCQ